MLFPDDALASAFLARFHYNITTVQIFHDKDPSKHEKTVKTFSGLLTDPENKDLLSWLVMKNNEGYGVFFMVNEGDGIIHPGKSTCRSEASVLFLKALFVDTDGQDIAPLDNFNYANNMPPHAVIESSPGRFHYYYLIEKIELPDPKAKAKWQAIQTMLANIGGYDPTMRDVSRLLRIPGFYHCKKEPFQITSIKSWIN